MAGNQSIVLGGNNVNTGDGGDGTLATGASPTVLIGGAFTVALPITVANIVTTGTYGIGGSTDNSATFSGAISMAQNLTVTQVATTGANALNITGGITTTGTNVKTLTFNNAGAVNVSTNGISNGGGTLNLAKLNTGTLTLSTTTTHFGTTTVGAALTATPASATANGGILNLAAVGAVSFSSAVAINNGGTMLLSAVTANPTGPDTSDRINTIPLTLGTAGATGNLGGTIRRGAFVSEGSGTLAGMGSLTLASASTIDFGSKTAGQLGTLSFNGFAPGAFTLNITNYVSHGNTAGTDGTDDRLIFSSDQTAFLTTSFAFDGTLGAAEIPLGNNLYEIVPSAIPEPSAWTLCTLGGVFLLAATRKKLLCA